MKRLLLAFALLVSACATPQQYAAADDIHAFMIAVRDNDRTAFNAHVDRDALALQLEGRILEELPRDGTARTLGVLFAAPIAGVATDLVAQPRVFRAIAVSNGYDPAKPLPGRMVIAQALTNAGGGRVCVGDKDDPCILVFARTGSVWRLTAFEGDLNDLRRS